MDLIERQRKSDIKRKTGFEKWMNEPMVRMGISMIPEGSRQEALKTLLESAFNAGFDAGCGDVVGELIEGFIKRKTDDRNS